MKRTVKFQESGNNCFINVPVAMKDILGIKKGDKIVLELVGKKIILKKSKEA